MRILIVDDDGLTLKLLQRYLQGWGHDVVQAGDGAAGWELFEREPFAMVITDWMMPRVDGLELIRRIRGHRLGDRVYAVLVTGRTSKEDLVQGMEAGADDFLTKPFDKDELRVRIREGERIVALERALTEAEGRAETLDNLVEQTAADAERDLADLTELIGRIEGGAGVETEAVRARLGHLRELVASLHQRGRA